MEIVKKISAFMTRPSARYSAGVLIAGGLVAGMILWGGTTKVMEVTSSEAFCTSCHEMEANAFAEYKTSAHYLNSSGMQVECADCHVPGDTLGKVIRKVEGLRELYGTIAGKIDSPEKYEAHRLAMAEKVWADMQADDSANCRSCHTNFERAIEHQYEWAQANHEIMIEEGKTCIDCHQGIAHKLPKTDLRAKTLPEPTTPAL